MAIRHGIGKFKNFFETDLELKGASLQQLQSALGHDLELEKTIEFFSLRFSVSFCCWLHLLIDEVATCTIFVVLAVAGNAKQF